jgi:hypothetical protein
MPLIPALGSQISQFETSLVYRASFRQAYTKIITQKQTNKMETCFCDGLAASVSLSTHFLLLALDLQCCSVELVSFTGFFLKVICVSLGLRGGAMPPTRLPLLFLS